MSDPPTTRDPASVAAPLPRGWAAAASLAQRELVRFLRQRNRVFGALGQPIIFWVLLSAGFGSANLGYRFFFPGTLVMILLFTAIFATISIIEDRREGFLQSVLVAPIPRWSMVLGKIVGGTLLAMLQGLVLLALGYLTLKLPGDPLTLLAVVLLMTIVAFALTSLGMLIAWRMDSTQGFHAIMSLFLLPMWLLSGAFFPSASGLLGWIVRLNPLTYGVAGLRRLLQCEVQGVDPSTLFNPSLATSFGISLLFAAVTFALVWRVSAGRTKGDLL